MQDRLHLYPTLGALLGVWAAGVAVQVVVQVAWWMLRSTNREQGQERSSTSKKRDDDTASSTLSDKAQHVSSLLFRLLATGTTTTSTAIASPQPSPLQPLLWRKLSKRSLVLTIAIAIVQVTTSTVLLYARTGALLEQPYEWYSLRNTGERNYKETTPLPAQILSTCRFRNVSKAPLGGMLTMDNLVAQHNHSATRTIVYVVPYSSEGVVELSESQVQSSKELSVSNKNLRPTDPARIHPVGYEKAMPVDDLTLFPYLWHSILGPHFDDQVEASSPWTRSVVALDLEYRIVRNQEELKALPSGSNVFAVVQWMPNVLHLINSGVLAEDANVGFMALSKEDCSNVDTQQYIGAKQLKFGLMPYGDCSFVDGKRFAVLPLGPSFEHGFPTNAHKTFIPPVANRKFLLNLMVSWTVEKPTRIQAMMSALQVCKDGGYECIVEHNDLMFKVLQQVDEFAGSNLRWMLSSAPNSYIENLKQSIFTLCPHGKNPEQYRIWEALAAGSIPIVEEFPQQSLPGMFYHPSYPSSWKCVPEDIHGVLRDLKAPVLFVRDWRRDLPRIIDSYLSREGGMLELQALQQRAKEWYLQLGNHLQADVLQKSLLHFKASSAQ
ncbi:hypothetical protein Gpo141_00004577 [Globisporangium polare]